MDRVFAAVEAPPPAPTPGQGRRRLVLAGAGLGLLVGSLVHLWQTQQRVQLDLQQERQWRMLERLRALDPPAAPPLPAPPAPAIQTTTPTPAPAPRAQPQRKVAAKIRRPRPRHAEPTRPIGPPPIRVPLPAPTPPLPELLGVVQTTGQRDSAIFSTAAGPLSVSAGESIGGTGWRLLGVTADSVEIGQGSERRSLSLGR